MINYLAVEGQLFLTDLTVEGSSSSDLVRITQTGSGNAFVVEDVASDTTPFVIDASGNVGIGTTAPTVKFEVAGSTTISSQNNVAATFGTTTSGRLLVGSITGNTPFIGAEGATNLLFYTNATERMRITSDGNVGIGTTSLTGVGFRVGKTITGAINSYASIFQGTVQADVTSQAYGVYVSLSTTGTPATAPTLTLFAATQGTLSGTVTSGTQRAYFADSNLIGATNNYAFQGAIPSGTGRWNLYMSGTAQNYLAGNLGIGTTTPNTALDVVGTVTATAFAGPLTGNVTGNVSGSAATVTGASQTAITGLGTITSGTIDGGSTTRNALIEVRSDTAANWTSANSTLAAGEIGFETNANKFKIGTGSTAWNALPYAFNATISTSAPSGGNDGDVWMVYS